MKKIPEGLPANSIISHFCKSEKGSGHSEVEKDSSTCSICGEEINDGDTQIVIEN